MLGSWFLPGLRSRPAAGETSGRLDRSLSLFRRAFPLRRLSRSVFSPLLKRLFNRLIPPLLRTLTWRPKSSFLWDPRPRSPFSRFSKMNRRETHELAKIMEMITFSSKRRATSVVIRLQSVCSPRTHQKSLRRSAPIMPLSLRIWAVLSASRLRDRHEGNQ